MKYTLKQIQVKDIKADKNQPRKTFDQDSLKLLAENILSNGLLNPIEVDEKNIITDGERRWRAHKLVKVKTITARVVKNKSAEDKLRRQLIFTLQDEEVPTGEKYESIVKLFEMELKNNPALSRIKYAKALGISDENVNSAIKYCKFAEEEPEVAKSVAPHIIIETATLPKEERKEVLKEFEGTKDKKKDLIRELVNEKKEKIKMKKQLEEIKNTKDNQLIVRRTEESLSELREKISGEVKRVERIMFLIKGVRKMRKLKLTSVKDKESFFKFIRGSRDRIESFGKELNNLIDNLEFEIIKE